MKVRKKILASKIHRATVTSCDLDYEGSITVPKALLKAAKINTFEAVHVWNVTRGTRFETYAMEDPAEGICINGAAAHLGEAGDLIIIATFIDIESSKVSKHRPIVVLVDEKNSITEVVEHTIQ